jgi:hypothetical protein
MLLKRLTHFVVYALQLHIISDPEMTINQFLVHTTVHLPPWKTFTLLTWHSCCHHHEAIVCQPKCISFLFICCHWQPNVCCSHYRDRASSMVHQCSYNRGRQPWWDGIIQVSWVPIIYESAFLCYNCCGWLMMFSIEMHINTYLSNHQYVIMNMTY